MRNIIFIAAILMTASFAGYSQTKNFIDQPYLEVNGYADTLVIPNEIFIKIIISEKDTKDKVSVEELENKMVEGLKSLGIITEQDLTIYEIGSNYRFYFLKKKDIIKTKQYILKVTDAVAASKVFMLLEDLDISNTSIEKVNHSQLEAIKNITRIKAVENAKTKAVLLTKALGQTVGPALYITDNENGGNATPGNANSLLEGRVLGVMLYKSYDKFKKETPKIEFEKIKISSVVGVKFILK